MASKRKTPAPVPANVAAALAYRAQRDTVWHAAVRLNREYRESLEAAAVACWRGCARCQGWGRIVTGRYSDGASDTAPCPHGEACTAAITGPCPTSAHPDDDLTRAPLPEKARALFQDAATELTGFAVSNDPLRCAGYYDMRGRVRVVVCRGRKVPIGTEGVVSWVGEGFTTAADRRYGRRPPLRLGIRLDDGEWVYTSAENVEFAAPEGYTPVPNWEGRYWYDGWDWHPRPYETPTGHPSCEAGNEQAWDACAHGEPCQRVTGEVRP